MGGDHFEREREREREREGLREWVRQTGVMRLICERREKKNIKENLAFVLNLEWYCSSIPNFLAFITSDVSDFLVFGIFGIWHT